jgi:Flp pilus assembly CpaE family ATPase
MLIDFASHHYRYTVLDIPRSDAAVLDALEAATKIVVVANQELATIRAPAASHPCCAIATASRRSASC